MTDLVRGILVRFRLRLEEHFDSRLSVVRLFGSYARGQATEESSDLDVLVLLDEVTPADQHLKYERLGRLKLASASFEPGYCENVGGGCGFGGGWCGADLCCGLP